MGASVGRGGGGREGTPPRGRVLRQPPPRSFVERGPGGGASGLRQQRQHAQESRGARGPRRALPRRGPRIALGGRGAVVGGSARHHGVPCGREVRVHTRRLRVQRDVLRPRPGGVHAHPRRRGGGRSGEGRQGRLGVLHESGPGRLRGDGGRRRGGRERGLPEQRAVRRAVGIAVDLDAGHTRPTDHDYDFPQRLAFGCRPHLRYYLRHHRVPRSPWPVDLGHGHTHRLVDVRGVRDMDEGPQHVRLRPGELRLRRRTWHVETCSDTSGGIRRRPRPGGVGTDRLGHPQVGPVVRPESRPVGSRLDPTGHRLDVGRGGRRPDHGVVGRRRPPLGPVRRGRGWIPHQRGGGLHRSQGVSWAYLLHGHGGGGVGHAVSAAIGILHQPPVIDIDGEGGAQQR
mmetsp:Transcript_25173/g.59882  ORF Transcript_25173/g.59882 Transcript_25173/m.59882 type:complete len:399 (-) Transcript_25173:5927-7123(-)